MSSAAADLLSAAPRSLIEDDLAGAFFGFVERERHAITALGRVGATSRAEAEAVAEAAADISKLGPYAATALARMFQASMADGAVDAPTRDAVARTLSGFIRHHPSTALGVYSVFTTLTPLHADPLLEHWLPSADITLIQLAARALGEMRLRRACRPRADRADGVAANDAAPLLQAIGRIGGETTSPRSLSTRPAGSRGLSTEQSGCAPYPPGSDELLHRGLLDTNSVNRGVGALALARRRGSPAVDAVTTTFKQVTESVESIMAGLAVLRLDDADTTRSMVIDRLVRDSDTVVRLDELLFNDAVSELEPSGHPRLIDLSYAFRWLRLRPWADRRPGSDRGSTSSCFRRRVRWRHHSRVSATMRRPP